MTAKQAKLKTLETRRALKIGITDEIETKVESIDNAIARGAFCCQWKGRMDCLQRNNLKENEFVMVENMERNIIIICWL